MSECHLVWFKRDLRVWDHAPLAAACRADSVICLYVYEPELINSPEFDASHLEFINESLKELDGALRKAGGCLVTRVGNLPEVFEQLWTESQFTHLWSHEETGQWITYQRDIRVGKWCRARGVVWTELPQTGVVRRLQSRDGWSALWESRMRTDQVPAPEHVPSLRKVASVGRREAVDFGLQPSIKQRQRGGESAAWAELESFLAVRGAHYRTEMSSPLTGRTSCSRISPHLTWGTLSMRSLVQRTGQAVAEWRSRKAAGEAVDRAWAGSLKSFAARLRWHCHFMQKLEDEPELEFRNIHRGYDGLREPFWETADAQKRFAAWCAGRTGYPMIDACMRSCVATGWLNFRMRAMLVSFAAYHLWLHWREPAVWLARHFLDFEPGIHYSQFQMQSGVTGINTLRIYSPSKQALDQDPQGEFIRHWVPELATVPLVYLTEPHRMSLEVQRQHGCLIGGDYPPPIVTHAVAYREARARFAEVRRSASVRAEAKRVYEKHGRRKQPRRGEFAPLAKKEKKALNQPPEWQAELEL